MLWKEKDHPRDDNGKFTDKGGTQKEQKAEKVKPTKKADEKKASGTSTNPVFKAGVSILKSRW